MRSGLVVGHNVDRIDIAAGLKELKACGYTETRCVASGSVSYVNQSLLGLSALADSATGVARLSVSPLGPKKTLHFGGLKSDGKAL